VTETPAAAEPEAVEIPLEEPDADPAVDIEAASDDASSDEE
jgi:hypothetical protein